MTDTPRCPHDRRAFVLRAEVAMSDWAIVPRKRDEGTGWDVWLDEFGMRSTDQPGCNSLIIGYGQTKRAALLRAYHELREHEMAVLMALLEQAD